MRVIALLALIFGFMAQCILDGQVFSHAIMGIIFGVAAVVCGIASARKDPPHRWQGWIMAALGVPLVIFCSIGLPSDYAFQERFNRRAEQIHKMYIEGKTSVPTTSPANVIGCDCAAVYTNSFWEDEAGIRRQMDTYTNVLAMTVNERHTEAGNPHSEASLHFQGSVVKSYKGDWKVSEKISCVHYVDYDLPTTTPSNEDGSEMLFIFTNEHTNTDIDLQPGDFLSTNMNIGPALECFFQTNASSAR